MRRVTVSSLALAFCISGCATHRPPLSAYELASWHLGGDFQDLQHQIGAPSTARAAMEWVHYEWVVMRGDGACEVQADVDRWGIIQTLDLQEVDASTPACSSAFLLQP